MRDPSQSPALDAYLELADQTWQEHARLPDEQTLRELAQSVEMSAEESERADQLAAEYTDDARDLLDDHEDQAVELLRHAVLLSPIRTPPHFLLAEIYARRFHQFRQDSDRQQAVHLAQHVQRLSPDHTDSHTLLESLGHIRKHDGISWKQAGLIVLLLVVLSGSMSLLVRYIMVPEVSDGAAETVREHYEKQGLPPH